MNGKSAPPPAGRGTSAPPVSDCPDDISKLFPLSSCRSQLIPPAPNRRRSAIDFLYDFCGSSWIAYGASSLLVISHFPSPLPARESLVGPFFRQVIEPSTCGADDGTDAVNAVSWCPVRPSEGEVAAAQGNSIRLYVPRVDNDTGGASSLAVFDSDVGSGSVSRIIVTGGKTGDVGLHDFRYIATGRSKRHQQPRDRDFRSSKIVDSSQHVDSANGMIWYIPKAHLGSVTRITTIPNTNMFLTGSKDGDVKLWDAKRAQLVFHWRKIHDRHTFIQPTSRSIGGVVRAAVTDIEVFSRGFLTCGGDGSVILVQLK